MKPELEKELAEFLELLADAARKGGEFALSQAPLVVQEKLLYGRVTATIGVLALLVFIAACAYAFRWGLRYEGKGGDDTGGLTCMLSLGLGLIAAGVLVPVTFHAIQVWFTPRLYIMEWIAGMLK
jgi:hypothetical protein